jgi:hypothetical protein
LPLDHLEAILWMHGLVSKIRVVWLFTTSKDRFLCFKWGLKSSSHKFLKTKGWFLLIEKMSLIKIFQSKRPNLNQFFLFGLLGVACFAGQFSLEVICEPSVFRS